ncbi:restriction endonuclease [Micromonospora sp. NPDC053740]|uniref:nSTAND3 domain-containing NTPase n=1 Tax=Micromonospora TaxID=1873 RepID=UPI001EE85510|nr:restriction endonuclease [Micromonospora alfalfae]MCG5465554.1 restriction endonuclease [Micromonospora alfalfae]
MDGFDVGRLTDFDFELVCRDLFEDLLEVRIEIFAQGRDGGVDLRHIGPLNDSQIIIQCKHWFNSSRAKLVQHMKSKEALKIRRLKPQRYILATSVSLTVGAKHELAEALKPYLVECDIYGLDEIVALLKARPEIVKRHIRLWLASTSILQSLLASDVLTRSRDLIESLPETLLKFSPNPSLDRARQILEEHKACMIVGNPGIGKSTLARVLCSNYVAAGYQLYEISADIDEANKVWSDSAPQVFYYDDFLGQTTLEGKLPKNEDRRLVSLLRRVNKLTNKRVIMTTREYILEQARRTYEQLAREDFDPMQCVLDLSDYKERVRAGILYNHVYFSNVSSAVKASFATPAAYRPIIEHRSFNPRTIEDTLRNISRETYFSPQDAPIMLLNNLNDPDRVWGPIYYDQLDAPARDLMEALFLLRREVRYLDLFGAWASLRATRESDASQRTFQQAVRLLRGTMIITIGQQYPTTFQNPSVADFMRHHLSNNPAKVLEIIESATHFEQLEKLWELASKHPDRLLLSTLQSNCDKFAQSLTWTLFLPEQQVPADRYRCDLTHRVSVCLQIANELELRGLAEYVADVIGDGDFIEAAASLADAVEVISQCRASQFSELQRLAPPLATETVEAIMLDLTEWRRTDLAVELLERLGDLAPPEALEEAAGARHTIAQSVIREFLESGMGATPAEGPDVFYEVLDYAHSHEESVSTQLDEVHESLMLTEMLSEQELSGQLSPEYIEVDEVSIGDMFALLAEQITE